MNMRTGWFGVPHRQGSLVHIVDKNDRAICGRKFSPNSLFQWCVQYPEPAMCECDKCKNKLRKILK